MVKLDCVAMVIFWWNEWIMLNEFISPAPLGRMMRQNGLKSPKEATSVPA